MFVQWVCNVDDIRLEGEEPLWLQDGVFEISVVFRLVEHRAKSSRQQQHFEKVYLFLVVTPPSTRDPQVPKLLISQKRPPQTLSLLHQCLDRYICKKWIVPRCRH